MQRISLYANTRNNKAKSGKQADSCIMRVFGSSWCAMLSYESDGGTFIVTVKIFEKVKVDFPQRDGTYDTSFQ